MDQVYSTTVSEVFFGDFVWSLLAFVIGLAAVLIGIFGRNEKIYWRIIYVIVGVIILLATPQHLMGLWGKMNAEPVTIKAFVEQKSMVDGDDYCTAYALETSGAHGEIVFFLPESAFERVKVGICYSFTYYWHNEIPDIDHFGPRYQYAGKTKGCYVTRIEVAGESICR